MFKDGKHSANARPLRALQIHYNVPIFQNGISKVTK